MFIQWYIQVLTERSSYIFYSATNGFHINNAKSI